MPMSLVTMAAGLLLGLQPALAAAQNFPTKPVRWIVPFPPGGAADISSRLLGQKLAERWGQQVIIDNRPGAGGNLGTEMTARAPPRWLHGGAGAVYLHHLSKPRTQAIV